MRSCNSGMWDLLPNPPNVVVVFFFFFPALLVMSPQLHGAAISTIGQLQH